MELLEVHENKLDYIKEALAENGIRLLDYMMIAGQRSAVPVYKIRPARDEKISKQLARVLIKPRCAGDFCEFRFDKFQKHYDPLKHPFGLSLIQLMKLHKDTKLDEEFYEVSLNVINSVRLNSCKVVDMLLSHQLYPQSYATTAYKGPNSKELEELKKAMDKPLYHGNPYAVKKICDNCLVVYKVLSKELRCKEGGSDNKEEVDKNEQLFFGQYSLFRDHPHLFKNSIQPKKSPKVTSRPKTGVLEKELSLRNKSEVRISKRPTSNKSLSKGFKSKMSQGEAILTHSNQIFLTPYAETLKEIDFLGFKKVLKLTNSNMNRNFLSDYYHIQPPPLVFAPPDHMKKVTLKKKGQIESCNRMYLGYSTANADELFKKDLENCKPKVLKSSKALQDISADDDEDQKETSAYPKSPSGVYKGHNI